MNALKSKSHLVADLLGKTVLIAYDDPQVKLDVVTEIIREFVKANQQVQYLDFDLQFSSLLQNLSIREQDEFRSVQTLPHLSNDISDVFALAQSCHQGGIIIIDSFNTLQDLLLLGNLDDSSKANHRTAVVLSLLQELATFYSKTLMILNLTRSRPRMVSEVVRWERDIVGGRMARFKSDSILYARTTTKKGRKTLSIETILPEGNSDSYELPLELSSL